MINEHANIVLVRIGMLQHLGALADTDSTPRETFLTRTLLGRTGRLRQ